MGENALVDVNVNNKIRRKEGWIEAWMVDQKGCGLQNW